MRVTLIDRSGSEVDLTEHVQPLTFHIERRMVLNDEAERELEAIRRDPRIQEQMRALIKLTSLRLSASLFGTSEAWVQSQLTDADRAALASTAEPVERRQLPAPKADL
jgi:hypothetical protein